MVETCFRVWQIGRTSCVGQTEWKLERNFLPRAWTVASQWGRDVEQAFWKHFQPTSLIDDFANVSYVVESLLAHGRHAVVLDFLTLHLRKADENPIEFTELVIRALEALLGAQQQDSDLSRITLHGLVELFAHLDQYKDKVGVERVARLEWAFLPVLDLNARAATLHWLLSQDPSFFADVISVTYRTSLDEDEILSSDGRAEHAKRGYTLLSTWDTPPGLRDDGRVDPETLRSWIASALTLVDDADRRDVGEFHIGMMLSHVPPDPDGTRSCAFVRDLLEELQSDSVEEGFRVGIFNSRGVTVRSPGDGGQLERELASRYREQESKVAYQWPRTAALLRRLAQTYEWEARIIDDNAERFRLGWRP